MSSTDGSGSGSGTGFFGSLLSDVTQVGMSYAAARGLDVNPATAETIPGIENGYYGVGTTTAPTSSSTLLIIGGLALVAVVAFMVLKR